MKYSERLKEVQERVNKCLKIYEDSYSEAKKKRDSAEKKGSYGYWAEWNFAQFIFIEIARREWKSIADGINNGITDEKEEQGILEWLEHRRREYVRYVLSNTRADSRCTSQVKNLIEDIEQAVYKEIAGHSRIDPNSLADILGVDMG
jgi:hypothetical protein